MSKQKDFKDYNVDQLLAESDEEDEDDPEFAALYQQSVTRATPTQPQPQTPAPDFSKYLPAQPPPVTSDRRYAEKLLESSEDEEEYKGPLYSDEEDEEDIEEFIGKVKSSGGALQQLTQKPRRKTTQVEERSSVAERPDILEVIERNERANEVNPQAD